MPKGTPDISWGRFDIAGTATVYAAAQRRGAFEEVLAYADVSASLYPDAIQDFFDDKITSDANVPAQWSEIGIGHLPPGTVPAQWREDRRITRLLCSSILDGRVVDLAHSATISVLRAHLPQWLPAGHHLHGNPNNLGVNDLTGPDRTLTCSAATWLASLHLPNGHPPAGVRYPSRHGADLEAYALWFDMTPEPAGTPVTTMTHKRLRPMGHPSLIDSDDRDLLAAADALRLTVL